MSRRIRRFAFYNASRRAYVSMKINVNSIGQCMVRLISNLCASVTN